MSPIGKIDILTWSNNREEWSDCAAVRRYSTRALFARPLCFSLFPLRYELLFCTCRVKIGAAITAQHFSGRVSHISCFRLVYRHKFHDEPTELSHLLAVMMLSRLNKLRCFGCCADVHGVMLERSRQGVYMKPTSRASATPLTHFLSFGGSYRIRQGK